MKAAAAIMIERMPMSFRKRKGPGVLRAPIQTRLRQFAVGFLIDLDDGKTLLGPDQSPALVRTPIGLLHGLAILGRRAGHAGLMEAFGFRDNVFDRLT